MIRMHGSIRRELLSRSQLVAAGWKVRQIDACLDGPDDRGPVRHWLGTLGEPLYDSSRVAVAAFRVGLRPEAPSDEDLFRWSLSHRPSSPPLKTFRFHRLVGAFAPDLVGPIRDLRISHPVMGRVQGSREQESRLVSDALLRFAKFEGLANAIDSITLGAWLRQRSATVEWTERGVDVSCKACIRGASVASYLSDATRRKDLSRFLDVVALMNAGRLRRPDGDSVDIVDFLVRFPRFRIDERFSDAFDSE